MNMSLELKEQPEIKNKFESCQSFTAAMEKDEVTQTRV